MTWSHRSVQLDDGGVPDAESDDSKPQGKGQQQRRRRERLDILTIGNSTYTLEPRISSLFRHPGNWGLQIVDLRPSDAGTYLCQISTFPPRVNIVFLEITGTVITRSN